MLLTGSEEKSEVGETFFSSSFFRLMMSVQAFSSLFLYPVVFAEKYCVCLSFDTDAGGAGISAYNDVLLKWDEREREDRIRNLCVRKKVTDTRKESACNRYKIALILI